MKLNKNGKVIANGREIRAPESWFGECADPRRIRRRAAKSDNLVSTAPAAADPPSAKPAAAEPQGKAASKTKVK